MRFFGKMRRTISVIVPVYNVENYLDKCIQSIQKQTVRDLDIILVDDGSTDALLAICKKYAAEDNRIRIIQKKNGGLSSARNAGLDAAKGEYINFIDSDDYLALDFYETLLAQVTDKRCVSCSHIVRVDELGNITLRNDPHKDGGEISTKEYTRELLLHIGDVSVCSKLFLREIIGKLRFDESRLNEDLLFMMDLMPKIDRIVFTGKIGYYYLCRTNSISSKYGKAIEDMVGNSLVFREKVLSIYPELKEEANRFALFQHMAYLLLVPAELRSKNNPQYMQTVNYLRRHFYVQGLGNKYLTGKNKLIIAGQTLFPGLMAARYQKKHK